MKKTLTYLLSVILLFAVVQESPSSDLTPAIPYTDTISTMLDLVAMWQLEHQSYIKEDNLHDYGIDSWANAVFYLGLSRWAQYSENRELYLDSLRAIGEKTRWEIPANFRNDPRYGIYHADELCIGQFYISMYDICGDPEMIRSTGQRLDSIIVNPGKKQPIHRNKQTWSWCDALFMAPPVYAGMEKVSVQTGYIDYMDSEFRRVTEYLYDKDEELFFRDDSYFDKQEANGNKIFWGRGNGWVIAGLANVLRELPEGHPSIPYYENLLAKMASRLAALQDKKGYWHASLLDPLSYPSPETSATALITYGIAYGINRGILPHNEFKPVIRQAWNWLESIVCTDGKAGWVQPIGADPKKVTSEMTAPYGTGAILMAGTEIYKLLSLDIK